MPAGIIKGATGSPGPIGYQNGQTTGILNELNYVVPEAKPSLIRKFGNSNYMLTREMLSPGMVRDTMTTTNTISHFEVGRYLGVVFVSANVTGVVSGANVTAVLKTPDSYSNGATGTQAPLLEGQTVKLRSNGRKATVVSINRTTAGAWSAVFSPNGTYLFASGTSGGTTLSANDAIETYGGTQLAGEASNIQKTMKPKLYRYDNTCTVLRDDVESTDLSGMTVTQVDFLGDGYMYADKFAVDVLNQRMVLSAQDAVLEGVAYNNTTNTGTIGVLPEVVSRGSETNYLTTGNFGVDDFQRITRVINNNGGSDQYHFLQDDNQRQAMDKSLFGLYPNGMINYGSVGFGAEAAVSLGFKSFATDSVSFHFHRYKGFSAQSQFGYTPTVGDYRADFGLACPQGNTRDAKTNETMAYMEWVYQKSPNIPTSQKYYSWGEGYTMDTKTPKASNSYHQICYVGSRVTAAEQFLIIKGVAS